MTTGAQPALVTAPAAPVPATASQARPRPPWLYGLLLLTALPIALYGLSFPWSGVNPVFQARMFALPLAGYAHVLGGGLALLIGGAQFSKRLRLTRPQLHRRIGQVYLLAVLAGGLAGLALSHTADGGAGTHIGFGMLAVLWLATAMAAWRAIRRGDQHTHARWMTRSYALTFAAVTLRIQLNLLPAGFGVPPDEAYQVVAWLAWVPNLLFAEWWLLRPRAERLAT